MKYRDIVLQTANRYLREQFGNSMLKAWIIKFQRPVDEKVTLEKLIECIDFPLDYKFHDPDYLIDYSLADIKIDLVFHKNKLVFLADLDAAAFEQISSFVDWLYDSFEL